MADLHPTAGNISTIKTSPPASTTAIYRKQPAVFGQLGMARSYSSNGEVFSLTQKPSYYHLAAWDEARRKEPIIRQGLEYITLAVIARLGSYSHPDTQIADFVQANLENRIKGWISDLVTTALWSGFSTSEINWLPKVGPGGTKQIWLDYLTNFHPLQVNLLLNDYGVLKDGDKVTSTPFKSGIYVPVPYNHLQKPKQNREYMGSLVRLPKSKRVYITLNSEGNNPFGRSILESVLPYHLFKEAFRDMMTVALDRYGTPLVYVIVPPLDTKEMVEDPDGTARPKTMYEMTVEQMENLSAESALVFTQVSKDQPVELGALTTGNNFSDVFDNAIELCDLNMLHGLGVPNLLIKDSSSKLGSGGASERQLELFNTFTSSLFDLVVGQFVEQAISQLIQYNFDPRKNPKAYLPGTIQKKPTRVSELRVFADSIKIFTELGYMNPANPVDFRYVREAVDAPDREPDPIPGGVLPSNRIYRTTVAEKDDPTAPAIPELKETTAPLRETEGLKNKAASVANPAAKHVQAAAKTVAAQQMQAAALKQQTEQAKITKASAAKKASKP